MNKKIEEYNMNSKIFKLTIPNIISNITVPMLGMVDLAIVGQIGDKTYIGTIAIATTIFNFVYWGFGFLRMGTSGLTAQSYGARDLSNCMTVLTRSVIVASIISFLLILFQYPIFSLSTSIMNTPDNIYSLVKEYFFVRIWAAPATLLLYAFKGWFIGMQNSKTPMWVSIFINIVNIVASLFFVFVYDMGIAGVALGTVIAQYSGLFSFLFITRKYYKKVLKYIDIKGSLSASEMFKFFNVNRDIFLRTVCLIVVFTFFTSASAKQGDTLLAVNTLFMQLFTLFSYIMDGFAYAGESLVGRYWGASNQNLLKKCVSSLFFWGVIFSGVFTLLYSLFLQPILSIFTSDVDVFNVAKDSILYISLVPFCGFMAFVFDGIMIGMTKTKDMRNVIFMAVLLFFAIYYGFEPMYKNGALWVAFLSFLLVRGVGQWVAYNSLLRRLQR